MLDFSTTPQVIKATSGYAIRMYMLARLQTLKVSIPKVHTQIINGVTYTPSTDHNFWQAKSFKVETSTCMPIAFLDSNEHMFLSTAEQQQQQQT